MKQSIEGMDSSDLKSYFHELSQEDINSLVAEKKSWQDIIKKFKQPDWCAYPDALSGSMGCWSLTDLSNNRAKINKDFCKDCDCFIK